MSYVNHHRERVSIMNEGDVQQAELLPGLVLRMQYNYQEQYLTKDPNTNLRPKLQILYSLNILRSSFRCYARSILLGNYMI